MWLGKCLASGRSDNAFTTVLAERAFEEEDDKDDKGKTKEDGPEEEETPESALADEIQVRRKIVNFTACHHLTQISRHSASLFFLRGEDPRI